MHRLLQLMIPSLALTGLLSLGLMGSASAQTLTGVGQSCSNSTFNGQFGSSAQLDCQIMAPSTLTQGTALLVTVNSSTSTTTPQCDGTNATGYSTQASLSTAPLGYAGNYAYPGSYTYAYPGSYSYAGGQGCLLQVVSGVVPTGALVGDVILTPSYNYYGLNGYNGSVQLNVTTCADPTCGGLIASPYNTFASLTPPPPPPSVPYTTYTTAPYNSYACSSIYAPPAPPTLYGSYASYPYLSTGACASGYPSYYPFQNGSSHRHRHHNGDSDGDNDGD